MAEIERIIPDPEVEPVGDFIELTVDDGLMDFSNMDAGGVAACQGMLESAAPGFGLMTRSIPISSPETEPAGGNADSISGRMQCVEATRLNPHLTTSLTTSMLQLEGQV